MKFRLSPIVLAGCAVVYGQSPQSKPAAPKISFVNDIIPILTKSGCANSNCHGSIRGQAGFKLSLFGYEPDLDYAAIMKDGGDRRVNRKVPEQSLVLIKPTYESPHGGGVPGGRVWGKSDKNAAFVKDNPVQVPDLLATVYHKLGIDYQKEYISNTGRPYPFACVFATP